MKKIYLIIFLILLLALPSLYNIFFVPTTEIMGYEVKGNITDQEAVEEVISVLETNTEATNNQDIDAYVSTIVTSAREETGQQMEAVFEEYTVNVDLLSIEVLEQTDEFIKLRVEQDASSEAEEYRDHVATVGITFVPEDGQWLITESMMENTEFN